MKFRNFLTYSLLALSFLAAMPQMSVAMEKTKECGVCYESASDHKRLIDMPCCGNNQKLCLDCMDRWVGSSYKNEFSIAGFTFHDKVKLIYTCPYCRTDLRKFGSQLPVDICHRFNIPIPTPLWVYGVVGIAATAGVGTVSYYILSKFQSVQFNSMQYSIDELMDVLFSDEPIWDFDVYNVPFFISQLSTQHDVEAIINSVKSEELQVQLSKAIQNFDASFTAVWQAITKKDGYYKKGKAVFMRDKKDLVQTMHARADELKNVLSECRAQVSIWKKALSITAAGALGVGAWLYTQ